MYINTSGLVLRETKYKDSSKILTVLTSDEGKLAVTVRGALRRGSKLAAVSQLLAYSDMTLYSNRDRWTLTEAQSIAQFTGLREDIVLLSLGSYFAEVTEAVADEDSPSPQILSLCLNALHVLSEGKHSAEHVKPAFEMRLVAEAGFAPVLSNCAACGRDEPERIILDFIGGIIYCAGCFTAASTGTAELGLSALHAARYITGCEQRKLFSFALGELSRKELSKAAEGYLLAHLDRRFRTLDFYKSVLML